METRVAQAPGVWQALNELELKPEDEKIVVWMIRLCWLSGYLDAASEEKRGALLKQFGFQPPTIRPTHGPSEPQRFD